MATNAKTEQLIEAPSDRMAELLRTSLAQKGFRIDLINDELCELNAQLVKSERISGVQWNYEFHVYASWMPAENNPSGHETAISSLSPSPSETTKPTRMIHLKDMANQSAM